MRTPRDARLEVLNDHRWHNPQRSASSAPAGNALLSVRGVSVRFGGIVALDDVSFDVARGDICGLIGPNGAGKTTLFNCMSRLYQYQSGDILFEGQVDHQRADPPHRRRSAWAARSRTWRCSARCRSPTT